MHVESSAEFTLLGLYIHEWNILNVFAHDYVNPEFKGLSQKEKNTTQIVGAVSQMRVHTSE